jgi:hypothetical protein
MQRDRMRILGLSIAKMAYRVNLYQQGNIGKVTFA